jgi:hypothetical protein
VSQTELLEVGNFGPHYHGGSMAIVQPGTKHFTWTEGETVVQVHGVGPWTVTYVDPPDDPRKK